MFPTYVSGTVMRRHGHKPVANRKEVFIMFKEYKNEIEHARTYEQIGNLFLLYEAIKKDFYDDKISPVEFFVLKKMILGL